MIIQNSDALRCWLTSCLGRLCSADPVALAKYVMALIKKDKPENELKEFCLDQLDVFLLKETKSFVELLFDTLKSKTYLHPNNVPLPPPGNNVTLTVNDALCNPLLTSPVTTNSAVIKPTPAAVADNYPLPVAVKNEKDKVEEITSVVLPSPSRETKRFPRRSRSSSKSHSGSPCEKFARRRSRSRESDGRRRRRSEEGRRHRNYSRRRDNRTYRNRRGEPGDRDRAVREKDSRRTNSTHNFGAEKQRSRSRSRSRSTSYDRNRSRSCTCSSSSTEYSRSRSRDRSKDHSNRSDSRNSRKKETPQLSHEHGDTDYRLMSSVTNVTSVCRTSDGSKNKVGGRTRCQDYDEKGFCMRGDQCPYDHGQDPLVVDDVSSVCVLNFNVPVSKASNSNCVVPPLMLPKPPGVESPIPPLPPSSPPKPPPPPPPPLPAPSSSFAPEPYNPEAPGIFRAKADQVPFWSPSSPPPLHPPVPPCAAPPGQPPILSSRIVGVPAFNPNEPPPSFHTPQKVKRTRELIGVPTLDGSEPIDSTSPSENVPASSPQQMASLKKGQTNTTNVTNTISSVGPVPDENFFKRKTFDYSRLGTRKPIKKSNDRCVLELRRVPKYLNNVTNLSNHFSQFGQITSILTNIDNDPEAALVCFSTHAEATLAYRNKEAVLHNRFIKVFWHNKDVGNSVQTSLENSTVSTSNDLHPNANDFQLRKDNVTDVTSTTPVISPNENKPKTEPIPERAVVVSNKGGNLSRTVFNPAALKKSNIVPPVLLPTKKLKEEERKVALKKKLDLHKKKQSILQTYIENEKMLIEKLAVCKNDRKDSFKKTIEDIRLKILSLKSDMQKEGDEIRKLMKTCNGTHTKATEKELLDAEMDLYNKQHKGHDVSDLLSKVIELKQQTYSLVAEMGRGRGLRSRSRMALRFRGSRGRSAHHTSRCVDHRPKKIFVSSSAGVYIDKEKLRNHFLKFGDIESIDVTDHGGFVISWKSRQEAEIAFSLGSRFGDDVLMLSWYPNSTNVCHSLKQENFSSLTERNRLFEEEEEEEEEDEEDSEARSWRGGR